MLKGYCWMPVQERGRSGQAPQSVCLNEDRGQPVRRRTPFFVCFAISCFRTKYSLRKTGHLASNLFAVSHLYQLERITQGPKVRALTRFVWKITVLAHWGGSTLGISHSSRSIARMAELS